MYHLASKPSYTGPLRAEVEQHLGADRTQWTKEAFGRCIKLDSFLKESQRLNGLGALWMPRLTLQDFTFSDGTMIPAGNFVATAVTAIHEDGAFYDQPHEFDGLRFSKMREQAQGRDDSADFDDSKAEPGGNDWMHRMTGTSPSYLAFGGGRHLWCV